MGRLPSEDRSSPDRRAGDGPSPRLARVPRSYTERKRDAPRHPPSMTAGMRYGEEEVEDVTQNAFGGMCSKSSAATFRALVLRWRVMEKGSGLPRRAPCRLPA